MRPENNRYGYEYIIGEESDLTPAAEEDLEPLNTYLLDGELVSLMEQILDGAGPGWYQANQETAGQFFPGPIYPQAAIENLGYPNNGDGGGAFHPGFNEPPADDEAQV